MGVLDFIQNIGWYNLFMGSAKTIIPTALVYNKKELKEWVDECARYFKTLHVDVVDASYGDQSYFDEVETFETTSVFENLVVHLMVQDPITFLQNKEHSLQKSNTTYIFKYSKLGNLNTLQNLLNKDFNLGVCFEIGDSLNVEPQLFGLVSEVMFVTVVPGKSGRSADLAWLKSFNDFVIKHKLEVFDNVRLSVDGGFNSTNADEFLNSKAQIIYANSFLRKNSIENAFKMLSKLTK